MTIADEVDSQLTQAMQGQHGCRWDRSGGVVTLLSSSEQRQ